MLAYVCPIPRQSALIAIKASRGYTHTSHVAAAADFYAAAARSSTLRRSHFLSCVVWCKRHQRFAAKAQAASSLDQAPTEWPYLAPLLLAFFASQKRSFFAAKSLVHTVLELYNKGQRWEDISLELKLAGVQEGKEIEQLPPDARRKVRLLVDIEKDVLVQWVALIFMTLKQLGIEQGSVEASDLDGESQMAKGMRKFVKQTLDLGFSLDKLQLQQQMAEDESGETTPTVRLMQENSRLIVLTNEIVKGTQAVAGSAYNLEAASDAIPSESAESESLIGSELRPTAARILLAFLGAARGSLYSVNSFLEGIFYCYRKGWSAQQVYSALRPEEFASGKTLFPVAAAQGSGQANAEIFGQWVSTVFITLGQVGVPHPAANDSTGWAWAGTGGEDDAVTASRLSHFVTTTLQSRAAEEGKEIYESEALKQIKGQPPQTPTADGPGFVTIEDPSIWESSSAVALMSQLLGLVVLARDLAKRTMQQSHDIQC